MLTQALQNIHGALHSAVSQVASETGLGQEQAGFLLSPAPQAEAPPRLEGLYQVPNLSRAASPST